MKKKKVKYDHSNRDFMAALGLDKDELFDLTRIGFELHVIEGKSVSECILAMVQQMKANGADELQIFSAGMVFSQLLGGMKDKDKFKLLRSSIKDATLPFTAQDLMKSIRDELGD
jgi:hypothetical protein